MCKITTPYKKSKNFTGFKSVVVKNKKLYSPVTGIEYKVGAVPEIDAIGKYAEPIYLNVLEKNSDLYEPKMKEKTGVFQDIIKTEIYRSNSTKVAKMTISGDLYNGIIQNIAGTTTAKVIVGNHIDEIELIDY